MRKRKILLWYPTGTYLSYAIISSLVLLAAAVTVIIWSRQDVLVFARPYGWRAKTSPTFLCTRSCIVLLCYTIPSVRAQHEGDGSDSCQSCHCSVVGRFAHM
ncbi:unnamed protein product [Periconia digitata]|uniref:Uncharacterized protein n=1 Tax=Periconia digitata TaxID=1303443 RepID=A0A9W4UPG2_9PLEO|nr:unnamed protein product [Periconia digitata]